jgi:hypothetical protein
MFKYRCVTVLRCVHTVQLSGASNAATVEISQKTKQLMLGAPPPHPHTHTHTHRAYINIWLMTLCMCACVHAHLSVRAAEM